MELVFYKPTQNSQSGEEVLLSHLFFIASRCYICLIKVRHDRFHHYGAHGYARVQPENRTLPLRHKLSVLPVVKSFVQKKPAEAAEPEDILTTKAVDLLAMETGYQTGEKPMTATQVESVLSGQLDYLEPALTRHGYRLMDRVEQFDAKPAETRALFNNQLDPARTAELREKRLAVGLPI